MLKLQAILRKTLLGAGLGLAAALFLWILTSTKGIFLKEVVDGYEFRSYDARFKAITTDYREESIDDVVIVDIDQQSINELGNYFRWFHDKHGNLIDYISSGNPKAILFDILFDPEPDIAHDTAFVAATYRSGKVYHALSLSEADTLNFQYPMEAAPDGVHLHVLAPGEGFTELAIRYFGDPAAADYLRDINTDLLPADGIPQPGQVIRIPIKLDVPSLTLPIPEETAENFPSGERFDIAFIDLLNAAKAIGSANFPQDRDGIIRRSPTAVYFSSAGQVYPSLTMAAAMDLLDIPADGMEYDFKARRLRLRNSAGELVREIPIDDQGRMWVNYYGRHRTFRYIPYAWVSPAMLPADYFQDKVVLIGSTLAGLMDLRSTPVQETFPGVEIHANVMLSLLRGEFVRHVAPMTSLILVLMLGGILGAILVHVRTIWSLVATLVAAGLWILLAYYRFMDGLVVLEIVRPLISTGGTFLSVNLYQFLVLDKDKRFLKKSFSTYMSPELIDRMITSGIEPKLGGESNVHTAFFTDIQSFSGFSEILTATQLVELLNEYLTAMTDVLLDHGGTLDKYEGDAIVAFYGAPLPMEDHALRAVHTALDMQDALAKLREKWTSEGDKWPILVHEMRMRVGINTGEFVTGNMGSATRMNYTMMGDIVNTAARLEASAKQYGIYIQCTVQTLKSAGPDAFEWRDIDKVKVMGKTEAVETVEIMSLKGALPPQLNQLRDTFQSGIVAYRQQKWDEARQLFEEAEKLEEVFTKRPGNPSLVYIERCDHFKANPPGADWDGSWTLTSK